MGIRLITEVLDHAPADLTPAERLVLVVIAESADDTSREGWPGMARLERRTGLGADGVRRVLQRLARRGFEVRVALGKDAKGRAVYSARGRRTTYRIPAFRVDALAVPASRHEPENGGTTVPALDEKGGTTVPPIAANGGTTVPPFERNGGTPVPQRRYYGPAKAVPGYRPSPYEPSLNPHPPTPHAEPAPAAQPAPEGEGEGNGEQREQRLLAAIRKTRPEWSTNSIRRAIRHEDVRDRPWPIIAAAFTALARDPETKAPGRLTADGPWWADAANGTRTAELPPPCGKCGPNRQIQLPDGSVKRCPDCHPINVLRRSA